MAAGSYTVTVTDANGCIGTGYYYIGTSTPITVTQTAIPSSCTSATGSATLTISGGQAPYSVTWSTSPVQTGTTVSNLPPGNYSFTVTDANGCMRTGAVVIPPANVIAANLTSTNASCTQSDGTITASPTGGSTPYTYLWSNAATTATVSNLAAGSYSVTIMDNDGCSITKSGAVVSASPVQVGLASTPASCQFSDDGSIMATPTGGAAPYTYSWNNGQTTATAVNLTAGNYHVNVTDANGCTASEYTALTYNPANNSCYCTITGTVFYDQNGNCTQDAGEAGIPNIQIHCGGVGYAYTDANGIYSFQVPSGTYTISESVLAMYPLSSCQNNDIPVTTIASSGCSQTINFANSLNQIHDLHISTWDMNYAIPGHVYTQSAIISNEGTVTESGIIAGYANDGQLNTPAFIPGGVLNNGGTNWYTSTAFPSLAPGTSQAFNINYNVPTNIPMNTLVNFRDSVATSAPMSNWMNDYSPWNNVNAVTTIIVSSYDPNFKEVIPKGEETEGFIHPEDSVLEYMVHFQNTGTYYAQNIIVIDTLSDKLDWKTLRPIYSSHPGKLTIDENGVMRYAFENINLPAALYGGNSSNGMFTYSVKLKPGLPEGTEIKSPAHIYFDYNAPVTTNVALNTIAFPEGITPVNTPGFNFSIYPNPANRDFYAAINNNGNAAGAASLQITDISGKILDRKALNLQKGRQVISVSTDHLTAGLYFVTISIKGVSATQKLVLIN